MKENPNRVQLLNENVMLNTSWMTNSTFIKAAKNIVTLNKCVFKWNIKVGLTYTVLFNRERW